MKRYKVDCSKLVLSHLGPWGFINIPGIYLGLGIPVPGTLRRKGKHNESRSQEECI